MTQEQATTEIVVKTPTGQVTALDLLESKRKEFETLAKESEGLTVKSIDDKE